LLNSHYLVTFLWNGQRLPQYSIDALGISNLSLETPTQVPLQPQQPQQLRQLHPNPNLSIHAPMIAPSAPTQTTPTQQHFTDPAILSFSKASVPPKPSLENAPQVVAAHQMQAPVSASLMEPFSSLELNAEGDKARTQGTSHKKVLQNPQELSPATQISKRNRRGDQDNAREERGYAVKHGAAASTNPKSKGWRQTAFVEPASSAVQDSPEPMSRSGTTRLRKKKSRRYVENPSGWATEDATDIQELGEFDFVGNLSKFDKRTVFEQIRNDDTTADEERLVSFNRRVKPGTNGGKNLHWTENVLDSPQNSDTGDDIEGISDIKLGSATISGRGRSRAPTHATSRRDSAIHAPQMVPQLSAHGRSQLHANIPHVTSPQPGRSSVSPMIVPSVPATGSLRLTTTNRSCPTVSPLQTLEIEQITIAEFGLADEIIAENAGRGIAEAAVALLSNDAAAPTMLVLTGNHRTGARAIAAARHLRNRGHRVTVCLLGLEHEAELLENCRKQLDVFRKVGGRVLRWEDLSMRLGTADLGPDVIIDALFGMHLSFDDLRTDDQAVAFEIISWVNRSNIGVLSVDVPSGINASTGKCPHNQTRINGTDASQSTGEPTLAEGGRLCINAASVVCLGAPKTGVLNALLSGERLIWSLSVADIGIPQIVWRKYGTRRRHGIDFGNKWVVPLKFQPIS
jgi:enhancer of mRNA-decapping protein 3